MIGLVLCAIPVWLAYRYYCKKKSSNSDIISGRERSMSFNSMNLISGSFIDEANAPSSIINIVQLYKKCPRVNLIVEKMTVLSEYYRFRATPVKRHGNWVFSEVDELNIERDHISESNVNNEKELYDKIELIVQSDLEGYEKIPLWHIHIIHNNGIGVSCLIIRIHHVIGDGISLVGSMLPLFNDITTGEPIVSDIPTRMRSAEASTPKPNVLRLIFSLFEVLYLAISKYDSNIKFTNSNKTKLIKFNKTKTVLFPTLKLEFVKLLKNKAGVTVNDIILSCLTGAIVRYCEHMNDPLIHRQKKLVNRVLMPVAFPRSTDLMTDKTKALLNKWAFISCELAINESTPKDRLKQTNIITNKVKKSPNPFVQYWFQSTIMPYVPNFLQKKAGYDLLSRHSIIFSNVPGPEHILTFGNEKLLGVQVIFQNILPQVITVSYAGLIFTNMNVDVDVVENGEKLLPEYFLQEINELASVYGLHVSADDIVNKVEDNKIFSVLL